MYIDEDGDVAHEFFVESRRSSRGTTFQKVEPSHLRSEGYVDYDIPRLHPGIPSIMVEMT